MPNYDITKVTQQLESVEIAVESKKKNRSGILPPGKIIFKNMSASLLAIFRVIPESALSTTDLVLPTNNTIYDTDGFYYKFAPKGKHWFKISDGQIFVISPQYPGMVHAENLTPKFGVATFLPSMWQDKNNPHWTINPF